MAQMWPRKIPKYIKRNPIRSTECKVFDRMRNELDDDFVVYYSRPWLGLDPYGEEIDGECDFIVAHAKHGLLTLEVKGGVISYDSQNELWTSRDRYGVTHDIKNPVSQARSAKHEILKRLKKSPNWESRWISARHGVVFPDCLDSQCDLAIDMPQNIFCFATAYNNSFGAWINERFVDNPTSGSSKNYLGVDGLQALQQILAKPFQLKIAISTQLFEDDVEMTLLTQQQFHILRSIQEIRRIAISGPAGTGKTVLAVEESVKCAENGTRTLFVCFNRGLAEDVRRRLETYEAIEVYTFHELCSKLAQRARLTYSKNFSKEELFETVFPNLLKQAFELSPNEKYGAVIVDEGQDFLPAWWAAIDTGLKSYDESLLRVFYDNNQKLYSTFLDLPNDVELTPYRLTLNLRNTKNIHEVVQNHYDGYRIDAVGPEGVEVSWIETDEINDSVKRISEFVSHLVNKELIAPREIAILLKSRSDIKKLAPNNYVGKLPSVGCEGNSSDNLVVDTIGRFKGLDRQVVIISATSGFFDAKELPYVALSRARTLLAVVGSPNILTKLKSNVSLD